MCTGYRSSTKLCRPRAEQEVKGNRELSSMSPVTPLFKNQPGLSSTQTLLRIILNVTLPPPVCSCTLAYLPFPRDTSFSSRLFSSHLGIPP